MDYSQVMRAELKVNIYGDAHTTEQQPYWNVYAEGDKQDDDSREPLVLARDSFPPGTRVIVEQPVCPRCDQIVELCKEDEDCDFNWDRWVEEQYG